VIKLHLPDLDDRLKLEKKWLANVVFTLCPGEFEAMVKEAGKARKARHDDQQKLLVPIKSDFLEAFRKSTAFSSKYYPR
jgi:hypothetical protein